MRGSSVGARFWWSAELLIVSVLGLVGWSPTLATEEPVDPAPDVQTLRVNKDVPGGNVVLSWSDGTSPFTVVRSESPNFLQPTNLTYVAEDTLASTVNDAVLNDGKIYYYLVSDANTDTEVYAITNPATEFENAPEAVNTIVSGYEGEPITIRGKGFAPLCANNSVYSEGGGVPATLVSCSTSQIQAQIPAHAISGSLVVVSPNGPSTPQRKFFAVGQRSNTDRLAQTHINVDANHNLFVADQTTGFNRIWTINFSSGAATECANVGTPIGMPRVGSKLYVGSEQDSLNNVGSVRELDVSCSPLVNWGATGTTTSDPVVARAMAADPSGNNPGYVFVLDFKADRIRRRQNAMNLDTAWLTGLGLGATTDPAASDPAGFAFNNAGEFFFTALPSKIKQYAANKTPIQEFTASDGLNRPAQIALDNAQTLWVANRDGNTVIRFRTDPANKLVQPKLSGVTTPRGLALDQDPATNDPWFYVADQSEVYRFRVYDTVHFDVKVLTQALGTTSQTAFESRVRQDVEQARAIYAQCGVEVVLDRVLFISDPNGAGGTLQTQLTNTGSGCPTITSQESILLGASRSSNQRAINVYYVALYREPDPANPGQFRDSGSINGATYTNDCFPSRVNRTQGGIVISRLRAATGGGLTTAAISTTLAHESGHFLLNLYVQAGWSGEHRGPVACPTPPCACTGGADEFYIMHGRGCRPRWKLTTGAGSECENIRNNVDEHADFVDPL